MAEGFLDQLPSVGPGQDPAGIRTVDDQMGDPMCQGVGLPGARASDSADRFAAERATQP